MQIGTGAILAVLLGLGLLVGLSFWAGYQAGERAVRKVVQEVLDNHRKRAQVVALGEPSEAMHPIQERR